jgi:HD-like signal output (HDOD) protein
MTTRREVFIRLNKEKPLPTPSKTTLEVIRLCRSDATSLNDIAQVIETDPALSAELLKYANAAFLATGIQVASVQKATVKLGMQTVVNLALGFSLLSHNKKGKCENFNYDGFWSTALLTAIAARTIAEQEREFDPEEIFICALLSDIGELALASSFPQEYAEILADSPDRVSREAMEKQAFEISSPELSVELFLDWGLPAHYALAAGFYDELDHADLGAGTTRRIALLLNLAHRITEICLNGRPTPEHLYAAEAAACQFGIKGEQFGSIFNGIIARWHELGEVLEIRTQPCLLHEDIPAGDTPGDGKPHNP